MKYQKYPVQTIKVAGGLRWAPATFENPVNIIILGKTHLWTRRRKGIKPNFEHFKKILQLKYETEKYIAFKTHKISWFNKKWKVFEDII